MVLSKIELGKLVKKARKIKSGKIEKRYTQVMLAKDINKSQGYIGDIESGRTYPTFRVLSKIAEACEVPFSFFGNSENETLKIIVNKSYPNMNENETQEFSKYILSMLKNSPPDIDMDLNLIKLLYEDFKELEKCCVPLDEDVDDYENLMVEDNTTNYIYPNLSEVTDVKKAMDLILSQSGLMLNGEILSDDSKIALANAINLGIQYAEQMQKKEK